MRSVNPLIETLKYVEITDKRVILIGRGKASDFKRGRDSNE